MGTSLVASVGKESACNSRDPSSILCWEDPPEKEIATHSSILVWRIQRTEEPGRLQSMGLQESDTDLVTKPPQTFSVIRLVKEDSLVKNVCAPRGTVSYNEAMWESILSRSK